MAVLVALTGAGRVPPKEERMATFVKDEVVIALINNVQGNETGFRTLNQRTASTFAAKFAPGRSQTLVLFTLHKKGSLQAKLRKTTLTIAGTPTEKQAKLTSKILRYSSCALIVLPKCRREFKFSVAVFDAYGRIRVSDHDARRTRLGTAVKTMHH